MPTARPKSPPSTAELIALALDQRLWAERFTCPEEQRELDRVADLYEALATMDLSMPAFAEIADRSSQNANQLVDAKLWADTEMS